MRSIVSTLLVTAYALYSNGAKLFFLTETNSPAIYNQSLGECTTSNRRHGHCIRMVSCISIFALLERDVPSDSDINNMGEFQCGTRNGHILVCCPVQIARPNTIDPGNILPQPGICGTGNTDRIYGENAKRVDKVPWMVVLVYFNSDNILRFNCGGTLINSRYVLTASKCVNGEYVPGWRLISVRLGEWDMLSTNGCEDNKCSPPPKDVTIEQKITYEDNNPKQKSQVHDIALLRLSESIAYTDWIKPICLPSATHLRTMTFEGFNMDTVEWVRDENVILNFVKRKTRVDGVHLSKCNSTYEHYGINPQYTHVCAGVGDWDIRASGGPLIGLDKSGPVPYFYLAGMFSFGISRDRSGVPSVYTRVDSYIDWIQNNIRP